MADRREQGNPSVGSYRIELRNHKGHPTKLYSRARLFRIRFGGKAVSEFTRFPDKWSVKQKRAAVELGVSKYVESLLRKKKTKKDRPKKGKPERKPAVRKRRAKKEVREAVAELPPERKAEIVHTEDDEFFWRRVDNLRERLEDIEFFDGQASKIIFPMAATSKGIASHATRRWDRKRKKWVSDRGNIFKRLTMNGAKRQNLIWWAARNYLRQLDKGYFETVARRTSKRTLSFRVFCVTNLPKHEEILTAPSGVQNLTWIRGVKNRKEMLERMTSQLVASIMRCLYKGAGYHDASLTSSGAFFQALPESAKSIGKRSTKTQNFKLAFTIFLETEFSR